MRNILILISLLAAIATVSTSCSTDGCTENRSSIPLVKFYGSNGDAVSLDSLEIKGIGAPGDSVLLAPGAAVDHVYLPLRSSASQVKWCIAYRWQSTNHPALNDTITMDYTTMPWFAGEECGAMYRYRLTGVSTTHHLIDSVMVLAADSIITNTAAAQMRIYFATE